LSDESIIVQYDTDKEHILAKKQEMYRRMTGIYFLIKESELVYVGQSADIMNRIAQHAKESVKDFDSYSILECPYEYLTTLEAYCIYKFRPRLNAVFPPNQLYKSFNTA
jgi:excinuclease UvrABC nuclease subunit